MDEVSSLPKLTNDQHSSTSGHLANFHNSISEQLMRIIGHLQHDVKAISDKTMQKLTDKINEYRRQYDQANNESREIIESMTSTPKTFEELREQLKSIGDNLLNNLSLLKQECVSTYAESFTEIKPFVDQAYTNSKDIIIQVPPNISERLQSEITRINTNFLKSKQDLTKVLFQVELNTKNSIQNYGNEFEQRKDKWKENRFNNLIEQAKTQLDSTKFVDFGDLFEKFYHEQANFTLCFRKTLSNVTFFIPPDRFNTEYYEEWLKEIDEDIECHNNFLKIFESKFTEKVTQQMDSNSQLLTQLETELVELKNENEANAALYEIYPLFKATQKVNSMLIEKIHKYWEHRQNCIKSSFDSIKSFLQPLITAYSKFSEELNSIENKEKEMTTEMKEKSDQQLEELEEKLKKTEEEISLLVSEDEINVRVESCRQILNSIEIEYHQIHEKLNALYDTFPDEVKTAFETSETEILELLHLKKMEEAASAPNERPSSSSKSSHKHKRKSGTPVTKSRHFKIDGNKFEEVEPIVLIPTFDDFIDEPSILPQKTKQNKIVKKPSKLKNIPKNAGKSSGQRGKSPIDDFDEYEAPEFALVDVVPKIDDVVSIFVYAPMPEEISEWPRHLQKEVLKTLYGKLDSMMKWATDEKRRDELTDELNERMRVLMPRMSLIQLNVAEARKAQVEARQNQLESFFRRQTMRFNSKLQVLQNNIDKLCEKMTIKCESMKTFATELKQVKSTSAFSVLNQNRTISENGLNANFDTFVKKQQKEIDDFFNFFQMANDRFKENVLADKSYSDDEREVASQYFKRMDDQIVFIHSELDTKASENVSQIKTLRDQISSEFETALPHNMADVALIEMVAALQKEYSSKFETLIFLNFTMERDLQQAMETVKLVTQKVPSSSISQAVDHQSFLDEMFAALEDLRGKLVGRGIFLKLLKSKISPDAIKYTLALDSGIEKDKDFQLNDDEDAFSPSNTSESADRKKNSRPASKGNDRKNKGKTANTKSAKNKRNQKTKTQRTVSVVLPIEKSANPLTFEGRIEQLRQDFLNSLVDKASGYYAGLKTRNFPITRPEQIPSTQQELVDKCSDHWQKLTEKVPSVSSQSILTYKFNVISSADVFQDAQQSLFSVFTDYYINEATLNSDKLTKSFDIELNGLANQRKNNMQMLNPKFANVNNFDEFNKLYLDEEERNQREKKKIQNFTNFMIECEKQAMNHFLTNLPLLVKNLFILLDRVPLLDDLKSGRIEKVERKTMRQLLIEKNRNVKNPTNSASRPFPQRDWPSLNSMMQPLSEALNSVSASALQSQMSIQQAEPLPATSTNQPTNVDTKNSKRKKKQPVTSNNANAKNDKNSKNSIDALKSNEALNNVSNIISLDTPLHRSAMTSRKKSYESYENKLANRLDEMKKLVESLIKENELFEKSWNEKVKELNPEYKPQKIEKDERPPSNLSRSKDEIND